MITLRVREAKKELREILKQKTVRISRLKKVLAVLDYEQLEKQYIQTGRKIKMYQETIRHLEKVRGINDEQTTLDD